MPAPSPRTPGLESARSGDPDRLGKRHCLRANLWRRIGIDVSQPRSAFDLAEALEVPPAYLVATTPGMSALNLALSIERAPQQSHRADILNALAKLLNDEREALATLLETKSTGGPKQPDIPFRIGRPSSLFSPRIQNNCLPFLSLGATLDV